MWWHDDTVQMACPNLEEAHTARLARPDVREAWEAHCAPEKSATARSRFLCVRAPLTLAIFRQGSLRPDSEGLRGCSVAQGEQWQTLDGYACLSLAGCARPPSSGHLPDTRPCWTWHSVGLRWCRRPPDGRPLPLPDGEVDARDPMTAGMSVAPCGATSR